MPDLKKKLIINYANATPELMEAIRKKYPLGWINHTIKVKTTGENFFFAITLDTPEASYLIKVPVKIDTKSDKEDEDLFDDSHGLKDDETSGDEDEKDKEEESEEN